MTVFAITLGFMPARILDKSLRAFYATKVPLLPVRHVLLDAHYPLDKERNRAATRDLCAELGIEVLDAGGNLGLHENFNWVMRQLSPAPDDVVIAYDGDSLPLGQGWDMALVRAIYGGKDVVWSSLMNPRSEADLQARGFDRSMADGYIELHVTRTAVTNSVCAWRCGWLAQVGGLQEPIKWYGHLESSMWAHLRATGKRWAFLPGWRESDEFRYLHDRAYIVYKWRVSHERTTTLDFESWLATSPDLGDAPKHNP